MKLVVKVLRPIHERNVSLEFYPEDIPEFKSNQNVAVLGAVDTHINHIVKEQASPSKVEFIQNLDPQMGENYRLCWKKCNKAMKTHKKYFEK